MAQVPTKEQLEAQLLQLIAQKAQARDTIEATDKQIPVISGMLQLLIAQEAVSAPVDA